MMPIQKIRSLTPSQERVLQLVATHPGLTIMEASRLLGCTHATATYYLNLLLQRGHIECQRDGREVRHFTVGGEQDGSRYMQALCRDPRRNALIHHLAGLTTVATFNEVARALGVPFGFAKRTLEQLEGQGLAHVERRRIWHLVRPTPQLVAMVAAMQAKAAAAEPRPAPVPDLVA